MLADNGYLETLSEMDREATASGPGLTKSAFISKDGRSEPMPGELVRVYRKLPTDFYSVQAMSGPHKGKVLGYAPSFGLESAVLKVGEKARQTVLQKGVRHVHAYCCGLYLGSAEKPPQSVLAAEVQVTYQPFVAPTFFLRGTPDLTVITMSMAWAYGADLWCDSKQGINAGQSV